MKGWNFSKCDILQLKNWQNKSSYSENDSLDSEPSGIPELYCPIKWNNPVTYTETLHNILIFLDIIVTSCRRSGLGNQQSWPFKSVHFMSACANDYYKKQLPVSNIVYTMGFAQMLFTVTRHMVIIYTHRTHTKSISCFSLYIIYAS